eukprot:4202152-Karenia_brevis.AAC.1
MHFWRLGPAASRGELVARPPGRRTGLPGEQALQALERLYHVPAHAVPAQRRGTLSLLHRAAC